MAKKKYKEMNADEKFIHDAVSMKKLRIVGFSAMIGMGIWMILTPEGMEHASVEKATVWLLKELWSPYLAIILMLGGAYALFRIFSALKIMTGFTWVKVDGGFYIFKNKERVRGLKNLDNGFDKIVFNPSQNEVYELVGYGNTKLDTFKKVGSTNEFNCHDTYWNADQNGYSILHKGEYLVNMTSEYQDKDLIVTDSDSGQVFRLKNYKANCDSKIRKTDRY